jgi:hypothetical protein
MRQKSMSSKDPAALAAIFQSAGRPEIIHPQL